MSRKVEGIDYIPIARCDDEDEYRHFGTSIICHKCAATARLLASDAYIYIDALGYKVFRVRLHYHCSKCGESHVFRSGMNVVECGKYVKANSGGKKARE
jgi:hypothetical protein